jgi:hypothetical protein
MSQDTGFLHSSAVCGQRTPIDDRVVPGTIVGISRLRPIRHRESGKNQRDTPSKLPSMWL